MREISIKGRDKDRVHAFGQMERNIQENGKTIKRMERATGKVNKMIHTLANGKMARLMVMGFIRNQQDKNMKENSMHLRSTERARRNFQTEINMKENIKADRQLGREFIDGLRV